MSERSPIRIVGGRSPYDTFIEFDGHLLPGVERVEIVIDARRDQECSCRLHFAYVDLELDGIPIDGNPLLREYHPWYDPWLPAVLLALFAGVLAVGTVVATIEIFLP